MDRLSEKFPPGTYYKLAFDVTTFVNESIKDVIITLIVAIVLVVLVIYLFLQDWRTTLIPAITIPVSLIGTFALMKVLGFSINTLTLFGLTLATGLVVDDAIVVIENIARFIQEKQMAPLDGASAAMREITGAVVATSLVLFAVFVPVAFFPGTTGQLYKQFALTIVCSIAISLFNALTLTPTLSALLLGRSARPRNRFFQSFNAALGRVRLGYHGSLGRTFRFRYAIVALFVVALAFTGYLFTSTPTGFTPDEDQGYFIATVQAPEGTSQDTTEAITRHVEAIIRKRPEVLDIFDVNGFGFTGNGPNKATMFVRLKDWHDRPGFMHSLTAILYVPPNGLAAAIRAHCQRTSLRLQPAFDSGRRQLRRLPIRAARHRQRRSRRSSMRSRSASWVPLRAIRSFKASLRRFATIVPQLVVDPDRAKAESLGVPLASIFNTMQIYLGSLYVNDFDYLNRAYRVYVQADTPYRSTVADLQQIYVKSNTRRDHADHDSTHGTLERSAAGHHALQSVPLDRTQRSAGPGLRFGRCDLRNGEACLPSGNARHLAQLVGHLARRNRIRQPGCPDLRTRHHRRVPGARGAVRKLDAIRSSSSCRFRWRSSARCLPSSYAISWPRCCRRSGSSSATCTRRSAT